MRPAAAATLLAALSAGALAAGTLTARTVAAAAEPAVAAPQLPLGPHAQGQAATIVISSISPDIAVPGKAVTVSGWVRNNTPAPLDGLEVQLWSSSSQFTERGQFDSYVSGSYQADARIPGATAVLPASVSSGQTVAWRASFRPDQIGVQAFGVYPLAAGLFDASGTQRAVERTFLPFWPGRGGLGQPLQIAWIWPLIDQPHRGICAAMLDDGLAANLGGGRLGGLLQAGGSYASSAKLTWAVDPALLDDAQALTSPYRVLDGGRCWQSTPKPSSTAARAWLATLQAVTSAQPVLATPYADPDVAALTHRGLDPDLRAALRDGSAVASQFGYRPDPTTAWPPDGIADADVLDNIVAADGSVTRGSVQGGIQTVVLDSAMMPPANPALTYTPDAVTTAQTGLGKTVRVLLSDHELTTVLGAASAPADPSAAGSPAGVATAISQRFLAETAMIAAEEPYLPRSVVVAPPRRWDPGTALASKLLADTVSAPWLHPAYLGTLKPAGTLPGVPAPDRSPLPANQVTSELTRGYLSQVRDLEVRTRLLESILSHPSEVYPLTIARLESSAWRGGGEARGAYLIGQAGTYLDSQERMVTIIPSSQVTLGGNRGTVPVSIENRLPQEVQVRLQATVSATRAVPAARRLTVTATSGSIITIGPHMKETVRLEVQAHADGLTDVHLVLLNSQGTPLPGSDRVLKVRATAFGTLALVIIAVALGVLVLTFVARVIRKGLREGRPGTVVAEGNATGGNGFAEAPDELADARGGAQPDAKG